PWSTDFPQGNSRTDLIFLGPYDHGSVSRIQKTRLWRKRRRFATLEEIFVVGWHSMPFHVLADLVLILHAAFIAFVMLGGLLALWKRWVVYLHLPALFWGAIVIAMGWICPLTPLE